MKFVGPFFLIPVVSQIAFSAEQNPADTEIGPFDKEDFSIRELIDFLQGEGAAVSFEEVSVKWEQGITYQKVLDTIGRRKPDGLNKREREWVEMAIEAEAEAEEKKTPEILHTIFHYEEKRFDFKNDKPTDLKSVLDAAIKKDPRYRIYIGKDKSSIAVVPFKNKYRERNILILRPMSVGEAVFKLGRDVTEPNGISHAMISRGPAGRETYLNTKKMMSMSLVDVSVYEALDAFTKEMSAAMKIDYFWKIGGYAGSRHFSFASAPKK